ASSSSCDAVDDPRKSGPRKRDALLAEPGHIAIAQGGKLLARFLLSGRDHPPTPRIDARRPLEVVVQRASSAAGAHAKVALGGETALVLTPGQTSGRAVVTTLREE